MTDGRSWASVVREHLGKVVKVMEAERDVLASIVSDLAAENVLTAVGDLHGGWYVVCDWCGAEWDPGDGCWSGREALRLADEAVEHDSGCLGWRARRWVAEHEGDQ